MKSMWLRISTLFDCKKMVLSSMFIISLFFIFIANYINCKRFDDYTLYRGVPLNEEQFTFLNNLTHKFHVNYWRYPGKINMSTDFVVPPRHRQELLRSAAAHDVELVTLMEDVQKEFDKQTVKQYIRRRTESFDWNSYYRLDDIYQWMKDLASAHPDQMKVFSIGKTHERRDILAAQITLRARRNGPSIVVEGGIHAREWISPAVVTYILHQVLNSESSRDTNLKLMAHKYEWYFIPVLNGDGYEYSHTVDRQWRKNRRGNGADLNRNFDVAFGTKGVSLEESSDIYCGPEAFSEPESKALADFVQARHRRLKFYLAFHSYGQHIIIPYAYSRQHLENFEEMKHIVDEAASKISRKYGTQYTTGTAYDTVGYVTSGVSGCWVKKKFGVPYVATFELRDTGRFGFALPPAQIAPTCRETMEGVVSILSLRRKMTGHSDVNAQGYVFFCPTLLVFNIVLTVIV